MNIPETFTGAVLYETGQNLRLVDHIRIPELKAGQALVKINYAGLCHSQLMEVRGHRGHDAYLPHLLGHEGTGIVIKAGPDVQKVKAGDQVIMGWIKAEGIEAGGCVFEGPDGEMINAGAVTTFSEYSIISENRLVLKPPHTPMDLAVLYGCALPTGAGLVLNELKPKSKASIVFVGLGGIGISALMASKQFDPDIIIAIDIEESKLRLAKEMGATHVFKADDAELTEKVRTLTKGGADYAIEAAGRVETIELAFDLIKRGGGQLIFASHPKSGDVIHLDPFELICGKSIKGTWGGGSRPDHDIPLLDQMYHDGLLQLEALLSHRYTLHEIDKALNDLENHKIIRALLDISH